MARTIERILPQLGSVPTVPPAPLRPTPTQAPVAPQAGPGPSTPRLAPKAHPRGTVRQAMASPSGTGPPSKRVSPPRGQLGNRSPDEWNAYLDQPGVREVLCQVKVPNRFLPFSFESSMAQEDFLKEGAWLTEVESLLEQGWTAPVSVPNPAYELYYRVRLGDVFGFKITPENCMSPMARSALAYFFLETT